MAFFTLIFPRPGLAAKPGAPLAAAEGSELASHAEMGWVGRAEGMGSAGPRVRGLRVVDDGLPRETDEH